MPEWLGQGLKTKRKSRSDAATEPGVGSGLLSRGSKTWKDGRDSRGGFQPTEDLQASFIQVIPIRSLNFAMVDRGHTAIAMKAFGASETRGMPLGRESTIKSSVPDPPGDFKWEEAEAELRKTQIGILWCDDSSRVLKGSSG